MAKKKWPAGGGLLSSSNFPLMEPKIFDPKMCEYGIFVAKMGKYGIFVAKMGKYGIFVAKMGKYGIFVTKMGKYGIFLSRNFVNTRSSIAFKDILRSSIAPQVVLLWLPLNFRFTLVYNPILALSFVGVYWIIGLLHAYMV